MRIKVMIPILLAFLGLCLSAQERLSPDKLKFAENTANLDFGKAVVKHDKLASSLVVLSHDHQRGLDLNASATRNGLTLEKGEVLVEIRSSDAAPTRSLLERYGTRIRNNNAPGLFEAWLPVSQLERLAGEKDVYFIRPAIKARMNVGASTTQGVAASLANSWHTNGITGVGATIANIDGGYSGFAARQATGDWPTGGAVSLFDYDGGGFGTGTVTHGTSTVEINFDMAPGANYRIYEILTLGDWYNALVNAANNGADVISVSLGAPLNGIGDGTALPGSVAEACETARNLGSLVVNAAGNERESHWGGAYAPLLGNVNTLDWGSGGNVNFMPFCLPTGFTFSVDMYWDDWVSVNHDYDLVLVEWDDTNTGWVTVASSTSTQNGGLGQTPQEQVVYTVAAPMGAGNVCPVGTGFFGLVVVRASAATNRNIQIFAELPLDQFVAARSLGFPADSPAVMTVAAVDTTTFAQESYSSEGPVLGPGGSLAASTIQKPNITAYANVDTESDGAGGFNGTSAATPHVAGAAALVLEAFPSYDGHPEALQEFLENCAVDLGVAGFDTQHGAGRLVMCNGTFDTWTRDNAGDVGNEPYGVGSIWHSPDIKLCQTQNCPTTEDPEFGQTNYIYVTLRNNGPNATAPDQPAVGELFLYYSSHGGAAQWPAHWTFINSLEVSLQGGEVREVEVPWTNVPAPGHYCMLSRWVSVDDPMTFPEVIQTTTNVRNNNNISWKNFTVKNLMGMVMAPSGFTLRNTERFEIQTALVFQENEQGNRFIEAGGNVDLRMDPDFIDRWVEFGGRADNMERIDKDLIRVLGAPARIYLPLNRDEVQETEIIMTALEPLQIPGKEVKIEFQVFQEIEEQDAGGVQYLIRARGLDTDTDGDDIPDFKDTDDDNDGVRDEDDANPLDPKIRNIKPLKVFVDFENGQNNLTSQSAITVLGLGQESTQLKWSLDSAQSGYGRAEIQIIYKELTDQLSARLSTETGAIAVRGSELSVAADLKRFKAEREAAVRTFENVVRENATLLLELDRQSLTWKYPGGTERMAFNPLDLDANNGELTLTLQPGHEGARIAKVIIRLLPEAPAQ